MSRTRRTVAATSLATLTLAGAMVPAAHADDSRLNVTGWVLTPQRIGSAGCRSIPVQAKVAKAPGMELWGVSGDIMHGTTVMNSYWTDELGKDYMDFCPTYDKFGAYTFGPSKIDGWDSKTGAHIEAGDATKGVLHVRRNSIVTISTARSGKYVTVKSTAKRFVIVNGSTGKNVAWPNALAYVQVKTSTGSWATKATVRSNSLGATSSRIYAPRAQTWRVSYATIADTAGTATTSSYR